MAEDRADEIMRHFDVVAERLEGQIRQVAEGVVLNGERLDRMGLSLEKLEQHVERLETDVRSEFSEAKSMIKLSFAELDRRLSTLEHAVEDLTLRVGHLEAHRSS